jgi:DNA-binding NtrC family response regulator
MGMTTAASQKRQHRVLVIEGDTGARRVISATLKEAGYLVTEAEIGDRAGALLSLDRRPRAVSAILCDIRAPKINDCEAVAYFLARHPAIPVIVTSFYPDIEWAIGLMKQGAADYLIKPVSREDLVMVVGNAVQRSVLVNHEPS